MREIKFRAWDKEYNFMYKVMGVAFENGITYAWREALPGEFAMHIGRSVGKEAELMQYTGLKDKNGKEIYEGDIVEFRIFDHKDIDTQYKGVIKYRSGLYEIWKNNDSEFFESDGAFILNFVWLQDEEFRVIGNIHTNLELLQ